VIWINRFADDTPPDPEAQAGDGAAPTQPADAEPTEDQESSAVGDEVNRMLALLLPWAISLLLHLGIGLLTIFVVWSAPQEPDEELVIPQAEMQNDEPTAVLTYAEDVEVTATSEVPREQPTQEVTKGDISDLQTESTDIAVIGVQGNKAMPAGSRVGDDPFGVGMYGVGGSAETIVYIVDASGSLVDALPFVIEELKDSLRKLSSRQKFAVIFFQRDQALPVNRGPYRKATPDNVKDVADWISLESGNLVPRGSSNPLPALELGLRLRPDLMYILSDNITGRGQFAVEQTELLETIEERKAPNTKINTIQFLTPDPLGTLQIIAERNGGRFRFVDKSVVGSR